MYQGYWRNQAEIEYALHKYTNDPLTLGLGVCEEAGELAKAINMFHNPLFKPSEHAKSDTVQHEISDILLYLGALANALDLEIIF